MIETKVARRYALALFKTAEASGNLEIIAADVSQLKTFAAKDKRFLSFLEAPQVPDDQKLALLKELFTTRLAPRLVLFLQLLLDKHRVSLLPTIADEFEKLMEDYQGVIKTRVVTAVVMPEGFKDKLQAKLAKMTGKKIEIIHKIDKSILGGIIVYLHNRVIDRSVRHQLSALRQNLAKIKVH